MFTSMIKFEWRYFTRQPSFFITAIIFFSLGFLSPTAGMSAAGNVLKNGPYLTTFLLLFFGIFSLFLVVNFIADSALRDHSNFTTEVMYSKPIHPLSYQLGKFCGSFAVIVSIFALVPLGLMIGSLMPWVDASRIGPVNPLMYLVSFGYFSLPTLFVFSCIFYTLAVRFRTLTGVYLAAVGVIILNEISDSLFAAADLRSISAILDPFAFKTFDEITRYWTLFEKDNGVFPLHHLLIMNRGLWLLIGISTLYFFAGLSKPLSYQSASLTKAKRQEKEDRVSPSSLASTTTKGSFDSTWQALWLRVKFEVNYVIFDRAFLILCLLTLFMLMLVLIEPKGMFGNQYWPVTQHMISIGGSALKLLGLVVIIYYSAEIVWREKSSGMSDIMDSLPIANFNIWLSKLLALWSVILTLVLLVSLTLITYQITQGYERIDLNQYFISMIYLTALPMLLKACLAFFCQIISPNKYAGMFIFVLIIVADYALPMLGADHSMFLFGQSPQWSFSDMNGYTDAIEKHSFFMLYWGALTVCIVILSFGLWQRGPEVKLLHRIKQLSATLNNNSRAVLLAGGLIFATSAAVIYYNTFMLNPHYSESERLAMHAEYEKQFRQYKDMPIPTMTSLKANIDIYPQTQSLKVAAQLLLTNHSNKPISRFLVTIPGYNSILDNGKGYAPVEFDLTIEGGELNPQQGPLNTHWFEFTLPLQPGEQRSAIFSSERAQKGFSHNTNSLRVLENGSFFQNNEVFPRYGYVTAEQILAPAKRKQFSLPHLPRAHDLNDATQYKNSIGETVLGINDGLLDFDVTLSTSVDQIALAPGYLTRQWNEGDRAYFHYKMDQPIANYFAFFSGKYSVISAQHNGVELAVYYHPDHGMNVQRIMQSMKDSLDYYTSQFGPYQHKQMRVVEFPGPDNFGQDFPNVIAYSESSGFIHDQRDKDEIDQVYWFIAHEMAHQWWGAQLEGANVQGGTVLGETLAQYSAYSLMMHTFGKEYVARMLEYELDRYLRGRSRETIAELPLMREENQAYLHYNKGAIVMMSIRHLLGEQRLNNSLKALLTKYHSKYQVYPTTLDLLQTIQQHATAAEYAEVHQQFSQINIYDLNITNAEVEATADGYLITAIIKADKTLADVHGIDQSVALNEMIDIAVYSETAEESGKQQIYLQQHQLQSGENKVQFQVDIIPDSIRVDPYVRLIDKDIGNNQKRLTL